MVRYVALSNWPTRLGNVETFAGVSVGVSAQGR